MNKYTTSSLTRSYVDSLLSFSFVIGIDEEREKESNKKNETNIITNTVRHTCIQQKKKDDTISIHRVIKSSINIRANNIPENVKFPLIDLEYSSTKIDYIKKKLIKI